MYGFFREWRAAVIELRRCARYARACSADGGRAKSVSQLGARYANAVTLRCADADIVARGPHNVNAARYGALRYRGARVTLTFIDATCRCCQRELRMEMRRGAARCIYARMLLIRLSRYARHALLLMPLYDA